MFDDPDTEFLVVLNDEEQYSIWPTVLPVPNGWHGAGFTGDKAQCLVHITTVWTDMRPLSLRREMAARDTANDA